MNELTDKFARLQIGDSPNDSKTPTVAFGYHYGLLMSSKDPIHEGKTVFKNGFTNEPKSITTGLTYADEIELSYLFKGEADFKSTILSDINLAQFEHVPAHILAHMFQTTRSRKKQLTDTEFYYANATQVNEFFKLMLAKYIRIQGNLLGVAIRLKDKPYQQIFVTMVAMVEWEQASSDKATPKSLINLQKEYGKTIKFPITSEKIGQFISELRSHKNKKHLCNNVNCISDAKPNSHLCQSHTNEAGLVRKAYNEDAAKRKAKEIFKLIKDNPKRYAEMSKYGGAFLKQKSQPQTPAMIMACIECNSAKVQQMAWCHECIVRLFPPQLDQSENDENIVKTEIVVSIANPKSHLCQSHTNETGLVRKAYNEDAAKRKYKELLKLVKDNPKRYADKSKHGGAFLKKKWQPKTPAVTMACIECNSAKVQHMAWCRECIVRLFPPPSENDENKLNIVKSEIVGGVQTRQALKGIFNLLDCDRRLVTPSDARCAKYSHCSEIKSEKIDEWPELFGKSSTTDKAPVATARNWAFSVKRKAQNDESDVESVDDSKVVTIGRDDETSSELWSDNCSISLAKRVKY